MPVIVVGVADCQTSKDPTATLVTFALGSCVGVAAFDPSSSAGGLLHILLPDSGLDSEKAAKNPSMFADTGIPALVERCTRMGIPKARLRIWLAGGAVMMDDHEVFKIGKRNQMAVRKALWKAGLMVYCEDLGGIAPRTVRLDLGSGTVWVNSSGINQELKPRLGIAQGA
jgi:chemotaxis protein CheD